LIVLNYSKGELLSLRTAQPPDRAAGSASGTSAGQSHMRTLKAKLNQTMFQCSAGEGGWHFGARGSPACAQAPMVCIAIDAGASSAVTAAVGRPRV